MEKLTDEQIDAAAKMLCKTGGNKWDYIYEGQRKSYYVMARAAAPFLQLPWDEPTKEESLDAGQGIGMTALCRFIDRRNASLLSKREDPRIKAVKNVLENLTDEGGRIFSPAKLQEISERIIFWIDEVK